jgi:3-oxoacyl-[acyl-carrier protein] reductase
LEQTKVKLGTRFEWHRLDLLDEEALAAFATWLSDGEPTMALVNNAGDNLSDGILEIRPDNWRRLFELNVTVPMRLSQAVARGMVGRRCGRIVNVGSVWALRGRAGRTTYSTTKSALVGLTRSMACDLAGHNVLVNAVCPGPTRTELTDQMLSGAARAALIASVPLGRMAEPAEVAALVHFLGSRQNTYITGQAIAIDGGLSVS